MTHIYETGSNEAVDEALSRNPGALRAFFSALAGEATREERMLLSKALGFREPPQNERICADHHIINVWWSGGHTYLSIRNERHRGPVMGDGHMGISLKHDEAQLLATYLRDTSAFALSEIQHGNVQMDRQESKA